jgi:molybdenum cofactor cytidylyltransferase
MLLTNLNSKGFIVCIVLAAGSSKRMGSPKQLLKISNTTLIGNACKTALNSGSNGVVVVTGSNSELIRKEIIGLPVTIIENKNWEEGIASSIRTSVNYVISTFHNADGILFTLGDQPLITSAFLSEIIQIFQKNNGKSVATTYKNSPGVPAIFSKDLFYELIQLKGDEGAKSILMKYQKELITASPGDILLDIDTPEDYKEYTTLIKYI